MPPKKGSPLKIVVIVLWLAVLVAALGLGAMLIANGVISLGAASPAGQTPPAATLPAADMPLPSAPSLTPYVPVEDSPTSPSVSTFTQTWPVASTSIPTAEPPSPTPTPRFIPPPTAILVVRADGCSVEQISLLTGQTAPLTLQPPANGCGKPELSPDGTRLAFLMPGTGLNLYTMNLDGSGLKRISRGYVYDYAWSPDGRRLAYAGAIPDQGGLGLYFANPDGSDRAFSFYSGISITPGAIHLAWSPDGKWIYAPVNNPGGDQSLPYLLGADGITAMQLGASAIDPAAAVSWMADSQGVSFLKFGFDYGYRVSLVDILHIDGTQMLSLYYDDPSVQTPTLAPEGKFISVPAWSPDGQRAVLVGASSLVQGEYQVLVADAGTGVLHLAAQMGQPLDSAVWSPDSKQIAFLALADPGQGGPAVLNFVNPDGSGLLTLASQLFDSPPVWISP